MLLPSDRLLPGDREVWERNEGVDALRAQLVRWESKKRKAIAEIHRFADAGRCYAGVSWGKDSVVLAHLLALSGRLIPLVWVNIKNAGNPDCERVRDAFLSEYGVCVDYHEITISAALDEDGRRVGSGILASGFKIAGERFGDRHISGVRGEESGVRSLRMMRWGASTERTCAPIGWWKTDEVFAYLHRFGLPVHPAYAMTYGGTWDRNLLRVATIGGERGTGLGRREHERIYYRDVLQRIGEDR